jgi:hypothetical protein
MRLSRKPMPFAYYLMNFWLEFEMHFINSGIRLICIELVSILVKPFDFQAPAKEIVEEKRHYFIREKLF